MPRSRRRGVNLSRELRSLDPVELQILRDEVGANQVAVRGTTATYTDEDATKLAFINISQDVDLDTLESDVAALSSAVVLKGTWDASGGSFPGSGNAQAGWSYIISTGGTVDGVAFTATDRIVAITDNASTSTYAGNWHKLDYTDLVISVAGRTGAITLTEADITDLGDNPKQVPSYTVATLPSAATAGQIIYVSDETGGAVLAFSDGTNWRRVTDRATVS